MRDAASPEASQTNAANRTVWLVLTVVFTFIAGTFAASGDWLLFWVMLGLWAFAGILLAVCSPGRQHLRQ